MSSSMATPMSSQTNSLSRKQAGAPAALAARRASSTGMWVGVFAITMSFAAFTSALVVREGNTDWSHLALPSILYVNTVFILASSATLEVSRRILSGTEGRRRAKAGIGLTLLLGLAFCFGQYRAWLDLRSHGIYLATNPNSSFFYVLTFMHALHVAAGLLALAYLAYRLRASRTAFRRNIFENTAIYWHFMAALWVYLLLLCRAEL
jgi:cytochrome c oxidase subunit 3